MTRIEHSQSDFKKPFPQRSASVAASRETIAAIKAVPLIDIIEPYVQLRHAGTQFVGHCPWHKWRSGRSFTVNPKLNLWRCWSCNIGGDAIAFVMRIERLSFRDSVNRLAQRAGIAVKGTVDPGKLALYTELHAINERVRQILLHEGIRCAKELDRLRRVCRSRTLEDMPAGIYDELRRADVRYVLVALTSQEQAEKFLCVSAAEQASHIDQALDEGYVSDRNLLWEVPLQ